MSPDPDDQRISIFAPLARDARAIAEVVEASGYRAAVCDEGPALEAALAAEALERLLCLIVTEEGAGPETGALLSRRLQEQPAWSSLPVLFLVQDAERPPSASRTLQAEQVPVHVLQLERPARPSQIRGVLQALVALRRREFETRDLLERIDAAERRQSFLVDEIRHRTRNTLSVLQGLFRLSARNAESVDALAESFSRRLRSLTDAHVRLAENPDGSTTLHSIFEAHVHPYCAHPDQLRIEGEDHPVSGRAAFDLSMTVHELATNATKYGALSTAEGRIAVTCAPTDDGEGVEVVWQEAGGPPVEPPRSRRLGSTLIDKVGRDLGGESGIEFRPEGLVWRLRLPLSALQPVERD